MNDDEQDTLIEFPCAFPIKVMGRATSGMEAVVLEIARRHDPQFEAANMQMRNSREGTYVSVTITVQATSRAQLDALYQDLCDHPLVTMVL